MRLIIEVMYPVDTLNVNIYLKIQLNLLRYLLLVNLHYN